VLSIHSGLHLSIYKLTSYNRRASTEKKIQQLQGIKMIIVAVVTEESVEDQWRPEWTKSRMIRLSCRGRWCDTDVERRRRQWETAVVVVLELEEPGVGVAVGARVIEDDVVVGAGAAADVTNWAIGGPGKVYDAPRLKTSGTKMPGSLSE